MPNEEMNKTGKTGLTRIWNACFYSIAGLKAAFRNEAAFRQESLLCIILFFAALYLGHNGLEKAVMIGCLFLVLIVELFNTAVEAAIDRISPQHHTLSGLAKDLGSAAVTLALLNCCVVWVLILFW